MEKPMLATTFGTLARLFVAGAVLFALTACGANRPVVCNAPGSSSAATCTCGSGTAACPISPGPEFLYAISITSTGGSGSHILAFSIDRNSGALTPIGSVPGPSDLFPTVGLAVVNNQFLFSSDRFQSQLDGFSINQTTGALSMVAGSPFSTGTLSFPDSLASPPGSNFLYASSDIFGSVGAFTISSTGMPSAISGSPFPGSGLLATAPSGGFLFAADLPGRVAAFTIGSTGALTQVPGSPFTIPGQTDNLPNGIVDTGSYVYTTLRLTNQIAAFSIVSGTGALTTVPGSPFPSGTSPSTLVFADGFLYALNADSISGYSVNSNSGVITPLSGSPFAILGVSMATDSLGQYLYVADGFGIRGFTINSSSGALTPLPGSPFAASGATLFTVVQIPPP
jgi:lactonase family protein with 7-bladed beta-propeller